MTKLLLAVLVSGCGSYEPPAPESAPAPAVDYKHEAAVLATTHSMPRADWPCGGSTADGKSTWTFTYGELASCTLPVIDQESGIVGCPTKRRIDIVGDDGKTTTTEIDYRYENGHLVDDKIEWKDGLAVAWDHDPFLWGSDGIGTSTENFTGDWKIHDGKLYESTASVMQMSLTTKLSWQGTRLISMTHESSVTPDTSTFTLHYDCKR